MRTLHTDTNQYRGINAHLHSKLQAESGWRGFHGVHITDLAKALQVQLRPLGYIARAEQGLQVRRLDERGTTRIADVAIIDQRPADRFPVAVPVTAVAGEDVIPLTALLADEIDEYTAIAIRRLEADEDEDMPTVAWLELLSPGNKPGGGDFDTYNHKRRELLEKGLVFIELDYLHASPTSFEGLPSYRPRQRGGQRAASATPYRIMVLDPRPTLHEGEGRSKGFSVDEPIPTMTIPLAGSDRISFDFNIPYQRSFTEMYYGNEVNYAVLPAAFDLYSPDDQARILSRMIAVLRAAERGENLEQPSQPIDCLPLDEAHRIYEQMI
jgi:hypothetical protein